MILPSLFGLLGGRDANTNLPAQSSSQVNDHPISQPTGHTQQSSEQQLWTEYLSRINPDITPIDSAFQAQLRAFHAALQHDSIESVLQQHFAEYDVWKFIQGRVSKKKYAHVRAQQDHDTAAYKELMSKPGWKDAAGRETLAFKCTMMYFGLPVQPMLFADSVRMSNPAAAGLFAPDGQDDDDEGDNGDLTFVPEEMRPLRFLNYYHKIHHGKDNTHISPERAFELFYTTPMTLRGGDAYNFGDEDSVMQDLSSSSEVEESLSVSSETTDSLLPSDTNLSVDERGSAKAKSEIELWGLSGRTVANFSHGLGSFFWAVDRLLALRSRSDADGGSKGITVSILGHPQGQRTPCNVLWDGQCLLGNRQREIEFLGNLGHALRKVMDEISECFEWKICISQISMDKHFKESHQEDLSYRPCLRSHQVASFSLDQEQQGALAYLFMPDNVNAGTAANHYQEWFKSLWCTLSRPDPAAEKSYAMGSSAVQPPESRLVRIIALADRSAGTEYFHSDVGPPREVWEWLAESYHTREQREFVIDTLPISEFVGGGSLVHIPGYFRGASERTRFKSIQDVIGVAMESIPEQDRASLQSLWIRPLRFGGFLDVEGAYILYQDEEGQSIGPTQFECSQKLQMWLHHGHTLQVQPRWLDYEAKILGSDGTLLIDHRGGDLTLTFDPSEPWDKVLARIRTGYTKLGLYSKDAIIRIDQRITLGDDIKQKNRTRWDLETVETPENGESWCDFVQSLATKQVTLQLLPKTAPLWTQPSNATPFSLREQQPHKFYWGCHDHPDDVITLYEEEPEATATVAAAPHHHHEGFPRGARHVPERDVDYQRRTTGWEDPRLQAIGRNNLNLTPQGLPTRSEGLDDFQRGRIFREWSYGHPLSIHMEGQYPEIPINAPPLEPLLKVPGPDGGISDSVPMISTQLMTATEQRRLQEAFFKMRSLALHRVQECPFPGCRKYFPVDEEGVQSFQKHLKIIHIGTQCPFCHDTLLDSWAPWQIAEHFMSKHVDQFSHKGDLRRDLTVPIYSKGLVHSREEQFKFCPRCGRNHEILDAKADRAQHDNLCFPGNSSDAATTKYCINCGEGYIPLGGLYPHQAHEQECKATSEQREEGMHCHDCGLPTHEFSRRYAHKHVLFCKGAEYKRTSWCPWCGIDLALTSRIECHTHLDTCPEKPYTGKNPIDTNTGEPLDSPRDTAETRRRAQHFKPMSQQFIRIEIPKICPIRACNVDLSILNAGGLFKHFYGEHAEATNGMKCCPLCHLDFQARGWAYLDEKRRHLDDHIERREERILADLQVSRATGRGDPALQEGLQRGDYVDENGPFQQLVAQEEELAQARDSIVDLQRDRKELQRKLEDKYLPGPRPSQRPSSKWLGRHYAAMTNLKQDSQAQAATSGVSEDESGVAGPSRAPHERPTVEAQKPGSSSTGSRSRRSARDATYRPSRRRPSDGDDDYREGEVPEPIPDLAIGLPVEGGRKRARETAAEAASVPSSSRTSSSAKKARTGQKEVKTVEGVAEGEAGLPVEISSGSSSSGESDVDTPSSGSSRETAPGGWPQGTTATAEDEDEDDDDDDDEEEKEEQEAEVNKTTPGRRRLDKGKAVAVAPGSSPRVTRSQAAQEEG